MPGLFGYQFKAYNSMPFSVFMDLCHNLHNLILNSSAILKMKLLPLPITTLGNHGAEEIA